MKTDTMQSHEQIDVLLVSMPFGTIFQPSIGLSLLKAGLDSQHISSKILYLAGEFARQLGRKLYQQIAVPMNITDLVGEWVFAHALFEQTPEQEQAYIDQILRRQTTRYDRTLKADAYTEDEIQVILDIRARVEPFLDECLEHILSLQPKMVGFTSVFEQHIASLAMAKRIKEHAPEICIVMGGANCEGAMGAEVVRQFPFVDAVFSGESDFAFPEYVERYLAGKSVDNLTGVYTQSNIPFFPMNGQYPSTPAIHEMDALPYPDYGDYFEQAEQFNLEEAKERTRLLFETSRGCWWGEKHHCTFCGLNGATMRYRSKSAERAMSELIHLATAFPGYPITVVDNILDMQYFKDFIPELSARNLDLQLFYEVKANLTKQQLRLLRDAGITRIQPGIESFSSEILKLMRKGVRGLQNVQLLKWCKEFSLIPAWNIIWGFPGEEPADYQRMAELIPLITHLYPPQIVNGTIRLDRFSPYYEQAEEFGFINVRPYPAYYHIYPLDHQAVHNLAYHFTYDYADTRDTTVYTRPVAEQIAIWFEQHAASDLFSVDKGSELLIWDFRAIAEQPLTVLRGMEKLVYLACDRIHSLRQLKTLIQKEMNMAMTEQEIADMLQPLVAAGLLLREDQVYLSLAVPLGEYSPSMRITVQYWEALRQMNEPEAEPA